MSCSLYWSSACLFLPLAFIHSTHVLKVSLINSSYATIASSYAQTRTCFHFLILTLSTVICCSFFRVTNVLIVSHCGQNRLRNVNVNVVLKYSFNSLIDANLKNNLDHPGHME